jgi:hypothetical protein
MCFWGDPSRQIEIPKCVLYMEVYKGKWYRKGPLIVLEEFRNKYLQVSHQGFSALTWHHEHKTQETQSSRWPRERDAEQSAPTHACHTHSASRQLGNTANQRYDVPMLNGKGSLRNPLQTHWNGIRCKEHLGNCPEADVRQATINLDLQVRKSLEDSLPKLYCIDLLEAYIMQEIVSLRILC